MSPTDQTQANVESRRPKVQVHAEWDPIQACRVHLPGVETFVGILDPEPNLFLDEFSLVDAQREHERLVEVIDTSLASNGVVHHLHDDLAHDRRMDGLLSARVHFDLSELDPDEQLGELDALWTRLHHLEPHTQLQAIACNAELKRHRAAVDEGETPLGSSRVRWDTTSVTLSEPLTNLYFQRDMQFVTRKGVVLCRMKEPTRRPEVGIAKVAWQAIDGMFEVDIVGDAREMETNEVSKFESGLDGIQSAEIVVEGGDFLPAGDFSLLGVSAKITEGTSYPEFNIAETDTEFVIRTSYAAGHRLLMDDVFGTDEVGLVRAPFEAARERSSDRDLDMGIMHLDTWFNFVDEDLVVAHRALVDNTTVDVYHRTGDEARPYELGRADVNFGAYIREKGFEIVDTVEHIDLSHDLAVDVLKGITNFLTVGPRRILLVRFEPDDDHITREFTEVLRQEYDVEVLPDDEGLYIPNLREGYGSIHCMTTPIRMMPP